MFGHISLTHRAGLIGFHRPLTTPQYFVTTVLFMIAITPVWLFFLTKKSREPENSREQRFRESFEQALIGIAFEDMNGKLLQVNPKLCAMLGYSEVELLSTSCEKFVDPEHKANERKLFQELKYGLRDNYRIEKTFIRKDGSTLWGRLHVCKITDAPTMLVMVEDITERKQAEQNLNDAQARLHELTGRLIQAQEGERRRIARELHDDIGQRLSLLMIEMEQFKRAFPVMSEAQLATFQKALQEVDELTRDVHELSHRLHSTKLSYVGLKAALKELCEQISVQQGIIVTQQLEDDAGLPPDVQLCFYRVAQEALNNIAKHSQASRASVLFFAHDHVARLEIADTGIGFDTDAAAVGLGLASMRERVRTVCGDLVLTSHPGKGTRVVAIIPYDIVEAVPRAA
jgi:PAS domain S-box-containing protein